MCHKTTTVHKPSPVGHVDPVVRALNTIMYGLVVHFGTMWMAGVDPYAVFLDDNVGSNNNNTTTWWACVLLAHEYWIYLQHSNVLANPFCQRLDRQYGIALLRSNQHWAIAGTLSAYWCRETLSMFLCLPFMERKQNQYLVLYSLIYHTIKSRGVRQDALQRHSSTFGIMRIVIDRFYLHTTPERILTLVRLALQGVDTWIHAVIVKDMMQSPLLGLHDTIIPMLHFLFGVWVLHAAMNQLFRCSTATIMVQTWHSLTASKGRQQEKKSMDTSEMEDMVCDASSSDEDTAAESDDSASEQRHDEQDFVVRHLLRPGRVSHKLMGQQGAASGGVDKAVRVETILAILATVYIVGLGDVPLRILSMEPDAIVAILSAGSSNWWATLPYAWLLGSILYAASVVAFPIQVNKRRSSQRLMRRRSILNAIDVAMVVLGVSIASEGSSRARIFSLFLGAGVTGKSFLQASGWRGPRFVWRGFKGAEIMIKLVLIRSMFDGSDERVALVGAVVSILWGFTTAAAGKHDDSAALTTNKSQVVDLVFLGHPHLLSDYWALWLLPYPLEERWRRPWWTVPLWPLHYVVGIYTCRWRPKIWGDTGSFFNCDDVNYYGVQMQTWICPHFGRHFVTSPLDVRGNIEAAARFADDTGVKVLCLGALNKAESINGGGVGVAQSLGMNRKVSVIHGNHLTAAAVVETTHQCFGDKARVFLTGASSKVGWAVAQALRDRFGYDILCHSTDQTRRDLFQKHGFEAASSLREGTAFSPLWIVGKYDKAVANAVPQGGVAVVFSVPHPLDNRKDVRVIEAGTLHMDLTRLDRPRHFCNKLKQHEIFACHAAGVVAAHRLKQGRLDKITDETGPVDPTQMDSWLSDAKALGFSVPFVLPVHKTLKTTPASAPVVVVGAGPSGLAVAASLHRRGIASSVLEAQTQPDAFGSWDQHFSGLEVTTQKHWCNLPGFVMTDCEFPHDHLGAKDYKRYLQMYADRFRIEIKRGHWVSRVVKGDDKEGAPWTVECEGTKERFPASAVVVATGKHRIPQRDTSDNLCERLKEEGIRVLHSTDLKTDETWKQAIHAAHKGRLCVVGFGNSAADLCTVILQCVESTRADGNDGSNKAAANIHVATRTVPPVSPRKVGWFGIDTIGSMIRRMPSMVQETLIRLLWWGLSDSSACDAAFPAHLPRWPKVCGRVPVIDKYGQVASALRSGRIVGHGPVRLVSKDKKLVFEDGAGGAGGAPVSIDMVIMATGYKSDCLVSREDRLNGLFRAGFGNDKLLPLKSIGEAAEAIAKEIAENCGRR